MDRNEPHGGMPRVFPPLHQGLVSGAGGVAAMENIPVGKKLSRRGSHRHGVSTQGDRILIPCNDVDRRLESDLITGS